MSRKELKTQDNLVEAVLDYKDAKAKESDVKKIVKNLGDMIKSELQNRK